MAHTPSAEPLDQTDPHHELPHHGHVIIRPSTLVAVLAALLFFTALTVFSSRAEVWISDTFHIHIPHLVNVLIALSIATVKCILVAMFFMQLKYDNPLNSLVALFCLFAFVLFLFLTMMDLGTRGIVYPYKSGEIQKGGLGISAKRFVDTGSSNIVAWARQNRIEKIGELNQKGELHPPLEPGELPAARYAKEFAKVHAAHDHGQHEPERSSANRSIPQTPGPTPGLYEKVDPHAHGEPGHGH